MPEKCNPSKVVLSIARNQEDSTLDSMYFTPENPVISTLSSRKSRHRCKVGNPGALCLYAQCLFAQCLNATPAI
jgi:hypothetical protein